MKNLHFSKYCFLILLAFILTLSTITACKPSSYSINETEEDNPLPLSTQNIIDENPFSSNDAVISSEKKSENLIPILIFYDGSHSHFIDYEKRAFSTWNIYAVNQNYGVRWGDTGIYDTVTKELVHNIEPSNCERSGINLLFGDYFIRACNTDSGSPDSLIQVWDIENETMIGVLPASSAEDGTFYVGLVGAPDGNRFLIADNNHQSRLFSINPLQEINVDRPGYGYLYLSPDKKYIVCHGDTLFRWTESGVEFVEQVSHGYYNYLSVSADAAISVFNDYPDELVIFDRINQVEVKRINEDDLLYGGFSVEQSALSHDGKTLILSGKSNSGYRVLIIDVESWLVLHIIDPDGIPYDLRLEYLPESIRSNWQWESY